MLIQVISTAQAKVTINGNIVPSVNACICIMPSPDGLKIMTNLTPYLDGLIVNSNIGSITSFIANDPDIDPEVLEEDANNNMIAKIVSLNYQVINQ